MLRQSLKTCARRAYSTGSKPPAAGAPAAGGIDLAALLKRVENLDLGKNRKPNFNKGARSGNSKRTENTSGSSGANSLGEVELPNGDIKINNGFKRRNFKKFSNDISLDGTEGYNSQYNSSSKGARNSRPRQPRQPRQPRKKAGEESVREPEKKFDAIYKPHVTTASELLESSPLQSFSYGSRLLKTFYAKQQNPDINIDDYFKGNFKQLTVAQFSKELKNGKLRERAELTLHGLNTSSFSPEVRQALAKPLLGLTPIKNLKQTIEQGLDH